MKYYETIFTEHRSTIIRVKADSPQEAKEIFEAFMDDEPEYFSEELEASGNGEWTWSMFEEVHPREYDERATITKNEDGTFDAMYEGGEEND